MEKGSACTVVMSTSRYIFDTEIIIEVLFMLMLVGDSALAYKTTLVTAIGIYILAFIQMMFKSGRPFWDQADISSNGHCYFGFAGPSQGSFLMTFFWPYVIIMFLFKYYKNPHKVLNWILMVILVGLWVDQYLYNYINGLDYIYQMVLGQLAGFSYLVGTLVFDSEVHRYSLRTGFSMRSSRARKFYLFFFLLGIFIAFLVFYYSLEGLWIMP